MRDWHRIKYYALLAIGVSFTLGGAGMVVTGSQHGWAVFLFFALCTAVFVHELWPNLFLPRQTESAEILLNRFPGPLVLRMPQLKLLYMLVGSIMFGGVSLYVVRQDEHGWFGNFILWLCVALIVLAIPFIILAMIRGSTLRLDAEGLHVYQGLRSDLSRWRDTSEFEVSDINALAPARTLRVVFDDARTKTSTLASINTSLIGRSGALPDNYGLPPEELAWLLNRWRERALSKS